MKTKELIEILQTKDPEALVTVEGYEGGYDIIGTIEEIEICGPLKREWWYGKYEKCKEDELLKIKSILLTS